MRQMAIQRHRLHEAHKGQSRDTGYMEHTKGNPETQVTWSTQRAIQRHRLHGAHKGQSRYRGYMEHTRHTTKTNKTKTQHRKLKG
jgi:hypothetical protein